MGNHSVGRAMAVAAKVFWLGKDEAAVTQEQALAALDAAGEDFIGADAEFDDELNEETDLSRLVAIAFAATPDERASLRGELESEDDENRGMAWYDGPETRFRNHFKFC